MFQVERQINPFWQLVFMVVILNVFGIENLARVETETRIQYDNSASPAPYSMVFRLALSTSIYVGLGKIIKRTTNK